MLQSTIRKAIPGILLFLFAGNAFGEENIAIKAGQLWDGVGDSLIPNVTIVIRGDKIAELRKDGSVPKDTTVVDLSDKTVLPGLIDSHTHILLQGDPTNESYAEQLLKESVPYRTIRAVKAVETALRHGFTSMRDLGTEGALYADVDLKKAIDGGVVPGPRLFVSTRAISSTGTYPLQGYAWELQMPTGVEVADGADAIRRIVRDQISRGADWIKYYADRSYFIAEDGRLRSRVNFTDEEMSVIVRETHFRGRKVAAHAIGWDGIDAALRAGADSIEHGDGFTDDLIDRAVKQGTYWCPTIYVLAYVAEPRAKEGRPIYKQMIDVQRKIFPRAVAKKMRIVFGTDAGGFPWTDHPQSKEFHYMTEYGMSPLQALRSATQVGAALLGQEKKLGTIQTGFTADLIAVSGNPLQDIRVMDNVLWVMKNGQIVRGS